MLKSLQIKHFRCFEDVSVTLRPLTVLIGENDTGKSVFLEAIRNLSRVSAITDDQVRNFQKPTRTHITGRTSVGNIELAVNSGTTPPGAKEQISPESLIQLPVTGVSLEGPGYSESAGLPSFEPQGNHVPAFVDYILRENRALFDSFLEIARSSIPGLIDVKVKTPKQETRRLDLEIVGNVTLPPQAISVGVRAMLYYLALSIHPKLPRLLLIEEPENGVHPRRLGEIVNLLRSLTKQKEGREAVQIILTTHSPYLLDSVNLETDEVLVFRRESDGIRTVEPVDRARLDGFLGEFLLGEIWYNQGEAGIIKKKSKKS